MAVVKPVFFDTTVLLGGYVDFGESSAAAQKALDAVADHQIPDPRTAWHCCLEFYAVSTRLPGGYRLSPIQAGKILREIIESFSIEQLPADVRISFLESSIEERAAGGRIYDAHIAEIARHSGAGIVVTDNRRHFTALAKHGIRILRSEEFIKEL